MNLLFVLVLSINYIGKERKQEEKHAPFFLFIIVIAYFVSSLSVLESFVYCHGYILVI